MIIDRAIVSTDNNPLYYEFWPIVAKGWRNIKIEPTVAVIGELNLDYSLGTLIKIPDIMGIDSGFIAQVIRFIIPCFFPEEVAIIGDIDMIPLNKDYFTKKIAHLDHDDIVIFSSDGYKKELRYPMCYIAAKGKHFKEIIGLKNTDPASISAFIKALHALNRGWQTDELFFYDKLQGSALSKKTVLLKREGWQPYAKNRIDRGDWHYSKHQLFFNKYIDSHSLRPFSTNTNNLKSIIEYIDQGSDGKRYFFHSLKAPLRFIRYNILLLKQNLLAHDLFAVSDVIPGHSPARKIISFSLYGDDPRYTGNLDKIIRSYQELLPDWRCRVYAAKDVNPRYLQLLTDLNCELVVMACKGIDARYMYWRFLAIEDKQADAVIIRDIDSACTEREKSMIHQWLNSQKKAHIIRDHAWHNLRIHGGLWGIKKNAFDIKKETRKFLMANDYSSDQYFLNAVIYPRIKNDVIIHDTFPRFPDEAPIVIPWQEDGRFIGEVHTGDELKD